MKTYDVYQYFGSVINASNAIGITRSAFYKWMDRGYVPLKQQKRIELLTKGELIAREEEEEKVDINSTYLPAFRYYDKKHGMCYVESIFFKKGKPPRITYVASENNIKKFSVFTTKNLMQGIDLFDCNKNMVYEGDVLRLKGGKKFVFKKLDMNKKLGNFKIIGNIFE